MADTYSSIPVPVPTQNAVPSADIRDHVFGGAKIDEFVTSLALQYIDRFGKKHYTIEGIKQLAFQAIAAFGYITMDSFEDGATLTLPNQVLRWKSNGEYYRWDGVFPKTVPASSTPASTGGIAKGAWVAVGANAVTDMAKRAGAVANGIQDSINLSSAGQMVLTGNADETVSSLTNEYGVEVDARRGRVFNSSGVQLSTYSDPRSRFVNGEQYLNYVINKMVIADGVTAEQKTYILWSGDSTIVGVNSVAWPPDAIGNFYAKRYGIMDVQNTALGHSGKTLYEWGFFYIDTEWAQHAAADLIVLRWGINDPMVGPYTLAQCKDALDRGLAKLRANKTVAQQSIIIMSPNSTSDTPNGRDEKWYEQLTAMLRAKAKQYKCMFFDTYGLFQDSRGGAGVWLDNPYSDGRGIHPNSAFSAQIHDKLFEHIYGPCAVINGSSNLFSNNGSSLQFIGGAYPPNTFHLGQSWWRTNPGDASWPVDGVIQVDRFVDGVVVMRLYGYTSEQTRICYTRMARFTDATWSAWRGLRTDITTGMLANGWASAAARSATYQKSDDGVVTIDAMLVPGTVTANTTIFTLPVGFRPKNNISYIACGANNGYASVNITTGGAVQINSIPASATVLTLNISFPSVVV